jgi:cysteine desulfurase
VAALYARAGAPLPRLLHGGGQEGGRRAGTENVLHIVGLGAAAALAAAEAPRLAAHMASQRDALQAALVARLGGADVAGVRVHCCDSAAVERLPNTLSIGIAGIAAAALLAELREEVAASAGAACHAASADACVSHVLRAMAVPTPLAIGTLRLSVGRHTTAEDVARGADAIVRVALAHRAAAASRA